MRCEHDTVTATLPGIPELPAKPPRTTQDQRMERMGYEGPKERNRCENCGSCVVKWIPTHDGALIETDSLRCRAGNFPVLRGGICNEWAAA